MRLQTLILPAPADEYRWVLILDGVSPSVPPEYLEKLGAKLSARARELGAVGALIFSDLVEVL